MLFGLLESLVEHLSLGFMQVVSLGVHVILLDNKDWATIIGVLSESRIVSTRRTFYMGPH